MYRIDTNGKTANHFDLNIHVFNMSNVKSGFSFHYPPAPIYEKNLYFLQDGDHFHYITNINAVIRNFKRNSDLFFCEECFKVYDSRYISIEEGHICSDSVEDGDMCEPV